MRLLIFTALATGLALTSNAQQKQVDTSKVIFIPPVIVKDSDLKKAGHPVEKSTNGKKKKKDIPKVDLTNFKPPKKS